MKNAVIIGIAAVIIIVGGVVLFHKSSNKNSSTGSTNSSQNVSNTNNSNNSNQASVATDKVTIQNFAFSPASITVKKGTTVTWTNQDNTTHTVTGDNLTGFASPNLDNGNSYSFAFNQTGTFTYHCNFHSEMQGTVTVQ